MLTLLLAIKIQIILVQGEYSIEKEIKPILQAVKEKFREAGIGIKIQIVKKRHLSRNKKAIPRLVIKPAKLTRGTYYQSGKARVCGNWGIVYTSGELDYEATNILGYRVGNYVKSTCLISHELGHLIGASHHNVPGSVMSGSGFWSDIKSLSVGSTDRYHCPLTFTRKSIRQIRRCQK